MPFDEAVEAEPSEVVGHLACGHGLGVDAEEGREVSAEVAVGEPVGQESEHDDGGEQGVDARVAEAERGDALTVEGDGLRDVVERGFADGGVVADSLDVEETSVGVEADLPECGQVVQPFADAEVAGVVDGGLGPKCDSFLVILLHAGRFVFDMQRRDDTVGEDSGPEPARCRSVPPADGYAGRR